MSIKKRKKRRQRLTLELILMTVISLGAGFLLCKLVENIGLEYLLDKLNQSDYYEQQVTESLESLQDFVMENQVTRDNMEPLFAWVQKEKNVYVMFYWDVDAMFDPYIRTDEEGSDGIAYDQVEYYDITLADGTPIKAEMEFYIDGKYFYIIETIGYAVGGITFIFLLFLLIHKKIRYINRLEQDLKILGSGNLEYPMTIRGNDELTVLAEGIEDLKNNILDQQLMKDEAEKANAELVTSMSHDLRTPLTSLIGYLELLTMHRYTDEEQLESYLNHCRDKAFQMKKMSDRLFEYFLVYGQREHQYQYRMVLCKDLLEDLCNGQFFDWQEQGGTLECQIEELQGQVRVDNEYLQRVMDNLLSNLKKYGDVSRPLKIRAFEREDMLHILLTNFVREQKDRIESTQIGLKTCRKIVEEQGGTFLWQQVDDRFEVDMRLPLVNV